VTRFDSYGDPSTPLLGSIFHPSDFSPGSERAFAHALAIALLTRSELTVLNADRSSLSDRSWDRFPGVRSTLERWKLLEPGSPRSEVFARYGVKVKKVAVMSRNPLATALEWVAEHEPDAVVLATEARTGLPGWARGSLAGSLVSRSQTAALFVPSVGRSFVDAETGMLSLRRILVPVAPTPSPKPGLVAAYRLAKRMGDGPAEITVAPVGDESTLPAFETADDPEGTWRTELVQGDVIDSIIRAATRLESDAIVMPTDGRNGFLDVIRGSHSEQVLSRVPCPLVTIPAATPDTD